MVLFVYLLARKHSIQKRFIKYKAKPEKGEASSVTAVI